VFVRRPCGSGGSFDSSLPSNVHRLLSHPRGSRVALMVLHDSRDARQLAAGTTEGLSLLELSGALENYAPIHHARADRVASTRPWRRRTNPTGALPFAENDQVRRFIERLRR
jgi:hypothetical protein